VINLQKLRQDIFHLGAGEAVSRLANIATIMLLGHRYGVAVLGVYALALSLNQYQQPLIDFGARHVGARLLAAYPQCAGAIVRCVQRRRMSMTGAVLPLFLLYTAFAKLPWEMKAFLCTFTLSGALYVMSLEWAAWGREELHLVGAAKAIVPLCILASVVFTKASSGLILWWAAAGNAIGFLLLAAVFCAWRRGRLGHHAGAPIPRAIGEALAWRRTSVLGLAWLCNLAFNSIDVLMLGIMCDSRQVGLYGAAYRILNQVLATYYLWTLAIYPRLARQNGNERLLMLRPRILVSLIGCGTGIALAIALLRRPLLTLMFGDEFRTAGPLLLVLAWSIPLDFMTSYLSNAYIAWGMEKSILASMAMAACTNVALNLAFIPRFGAKAAAANTLLSYVVFLLALACAARRVKELGRTADSTVLLPSRVPAIADSL
jgi:O-antigen/teichoic acid export membrane protein